MLSPRPSARPSVLRKAAGFASERLAVVPCCKASTLQQVQHRPPHGSLTHPPLPPELLAQVHRLSPAETRFLGVFSLCLSRACLGKLIAFSIKWRKRCGFPAPGLWEVGVSLSPAFSQPPSHLLEQQCPPCEKRHSFWSFPNASPEPVLVK